MAFNGTGTFTRIYNWVNDKANGFKITASRMDGEFDGIATGLSSCITKDGQTTLTGNIPFANFKITGLGTGSARSDSLNIGQLQDNQFLYLGTTSGSADAYTLAPSPAITSYATTQQFTVKIHATNATTTPYLQISAIANPTTTAVIKKLNSSKAEIATEAGDLIANGIYKFQRNSANDAWIVLNPSKPKDILATSTNQGIAYLPIPIDPITAGNNSSTPNTDIDFFAGTFTASDFSIQAKATAMTKRLQSTGSWSAGNNGNGLLNSGLARASNSTYHWYALYKTSDGSIDYGCILGVAGTAPDPTSVLPSGYSKFQYIFSVLTDASTNIRRASYSYRFDGSYTCEYNTYLEDRALSPSPTTATLISLRVPLGLKLTAKNILYGVYTNVSTRIHIVLIDPAKTTVVASSGNFNFSGYQSSSTNGNTAPIETLTDTSGRVSLMSTSGADSQIITTGFTYNPYNR
jgi:hypothetical protein